MQTQPENTIISPAVGSLRVWHIPQVPMKGFLIPVQSVAEGVFVMDLLARYDDFQLNNWIKPDYSNASGLQMYSGEGYTADGWEDWDFEGYDDPEEYLKDKGEVREWTGTPFGARLNRRRH